MSNKDTSSRVAIQETYPIPGYAVYGGEIPKDFTIRAMTTVEEKLRLAGTGFEVIPQLIKACTVSPEDVDISELKLFDIQFLMYKLRIITYGPDYKLHLTCPHCGKEFDITLDLDELECTEIPEDFEEPFEIGPLPISGDILTCKILNIQEYLDIIKEAKRIKNKNPNYVGDPEFILNYQYQIIAINGKDDLKPFEKRQYVESMHARDLRYLDSNYVDKTAGYGLDTAIFELCPHCEGEITFDLPVTEEFFRPTY